MSKPLGRDRLGRFIYKGDVGTLANYPADEKFVVRCTDDNSNVMVEGYWLWCTMPPEWASRDFMVDLALSPKLTNYDRYFGDMDRRSVIDAAKTICDETSARRPHDCVKECPFDDWFKFDVSSGGLCLAAFVNWLDMEATI